MMQTPQYFVPRMNRNLTEQYLKYYMKEPERFNPTQVQFLKQHAAYYQLPFREVTEDEVHFNLFRALRYLGEGWLQGFTTLKIGEQAPPNPWERVARAVGQAAGYAGYLLPIGPFKGVAKAVSARSVPLLVSNAAMKKVVPTATKYVTSLTTKVAAEAALGKMGAVNSALKFLGKPVVGDVIEGATRLGIAGAVSNWQNGIDAMLHGFAGGAYMEAGDRLIANALGTLIGGPSAGLSTQAIARTITGAMWNGLPSTMRRETTPEQIYEYLIGGFFAYRDRPVTEKQAYKLMQPYWKPTSKLPDTPEEINGYAEADPRTQKVVRELFYSTIGSKEARNFLAIKIAEVIPKEYGIPEELIDKTQNNIESWQREVAAVKERQVELLEKQQNLANQIAEATIEEPTKPALITPEPLPPEAIKSLKPVKTRIFDQDTKDILAGKKTTITRSITTAKNIGLEFGESGLIEIGNKRFKITNTGTDKATKVVTYSIEPLTVQTVLPPPTPEEAAARAQQAGMKKAQEELNEVENRIPDQLIKAIQQDFAEYGFPAIDDATARSIILGYRDARNRLKDIQRGVTKLTEIVPEEYYTADGFRTAQLSLSTVIVTDGENEFSIAGRKEINPDFISKDDVVAFIPTQGKVTPDIERIRNITKAEATVITPDAFDRGSDPYWKDFEQYMKAQGYDDKDTGIWIKNTGVNADSVTQRELFRAFMSDAIIKSNTPETNWDQQLARSFKRILPEEQATDDNVKKITNNFITEVGKNPDKQTLYKWIDKNKDRFRENLTDSDYAVLNKYVIMKKYYDYTGDNYYIKHNRTRLPRTDIVVDSFEVQPIQYGEVVGGKKMSQLLPKDRPIFRLVRGLSERTSSPLKTITWHVAPDKIESAMPNFYAEFQQLRHNGMFSKVFTEMEKGYEDPNIVDPTTGKKVVNKYIYIGGRNDKGEFNFVVKHPETDTLQFQQLQEEIARYTNTSIRKVRELHEQDFHRFINEIIGEESYKSNPKYWRQYYETQYKNTLLYLRDFNQATDFSFINKPGFINSASNLNKRFQIIFNQGAGLQPEDFIADPGVDLKNIRVVVADVKHAIKSKQAIDPTVEEAIEDGNVYVSQQFLDAINASAGLPVSGRTNKSFIVHSDSEGGMMLGKYLMKVASPQLQEWMKANGVDMVADDNAIKQLGARNKTLLRIAEDGKIVADSDVSAYSIDINDIKVVLTEITDAAGINHVNPLTKQMLVHLNQSKEVRNDIIQNILVRGARGNDFINLKYDDILKRNEYTDEDLKYISEHIDDVSIDRISQMLYSGNTKVIKAIVKKIANINDLNDMFDEIEGFAPDEFSTKQSSYQNVIDTLVSMKHDISLADKFAVRYISSLFNKYVVKRAMRPKIGNSVYKIKNRGWAFENTQIARDEFMLGRNLRELNIELNNKVYKLGELWEIAQGRRKPPKGLSRGFIQDFFNHVAVQRIPQDNPAGMQILRFKGFSDIDSNEIMIHSTSKEVTGGSDDDGDSYYLWFAGRRDDGSGKGMKLSWLKEMKKNNDMWRGQKIKQYQDESGRKADEEVFGAITPPREYLKQIMSTPVLLGAPGTTAKTSLATTYARNLLGIVVNNTTAMKQAYYNALDTKTPIIVSTEEGKFELIPKPETDPEVDWAIRKIAVAITKVADPTDFDEVPSFDEPAARILFNLFKVKMNGKVVTYEDMQEMRFVSDVEINPAVYLHNIALSPFRKLNTALSGRYDYFTTKSYIESFNRTFANSATYFSGVARALGGVDWNFDLTSVVGNRLPYMYQTLQRLTMEERKHGAPNWEQIMHEMTRHPVVISDYSEVVKYIESSDSKKLKGFLKDIQRAIEYQKSGKKYNGVESYAEYDEATDTVRLLLGKSFLNKSLWTTDRLLDIYNDMVAIKRTSDLSPEKVKKFLEKAKDILPKDDLKGDPYEVYGKARAKILELIQQDLIDMTTYIALKGVSKQAFEADRDYYIKTLFPKINEIFRNVNAYKSKISRDDTGEVSVPIEIADIDQKWYRRSLDPTMQKIHDIFMMGSFQAKLPNSYMREVYKDKDGNIIGKENIEDYVERIYQQRNATNHSNMGLATSVVPFEVKEAFYGIQQRWLDEINKYMFKPNSQVISKALAHPEATLPTKKSEEAEVIPKSLTQLKREYKRVTNELNRLQEKEKSLDKSLRLVKVDDVFNLIGEKKRVFMEQAKLISKKPEEYAGADKLNVDRLIANIKANLEYYGFPEKTDIPIEGLTRFYFNKSMSQMTIQDWQAFDNILTNMRKPTFIQKIFGDKYGEQPWIRKIDYFLFPEAIDKRLLTQPGMKANMVKTAYIAQDGSIQEGWAFAPTSVMGSLQNTVGNILFEGTRQEEQLAGRFSQEIEPYIEQPGIFGRRIWEYESIVRDQHAAEVLSEWYALQGDLETSDLFARDAVYYKDKAESFRNRYMDVFIRKYRINTGTEILELTGDEIQQRISDIVTKYNEEISHIQRGILDDNNENIYLKRYRVTPATLFGEKITRRILGGRNINEMMKDITLFDTNKFQLDMHDLLAKGKSFPMQELGIDGIYRLSQSAAIQQEILEADRVTKDDDGEFNNMLVDIIKSHIDDQPPWTGELPYEYYYPHRGEDIVQLKEKLLPKIQDVVDKFQAIITEEEDVNRKLHELVPDEEAIYTLNAKQQAEYERLIKLREQILSEKYDLSYLYLNLNQRIHSSEEMLRIDEHIHNADRIHELAMENLRRSEAKKTAYQNDAMLWELAGKKRLSSQERRSPEIIDYNRVPEEYINHNKDVLRTFHKNMAWLLSKYIITDAEINNVYGDATDSWVKFFKLYVNDSLGNPNVITQDMLSDPNMKLKRNPYLFFTDSYQANFLYKLGKMTGVIKTSGVIPPELQRVDYWTLNRISQAEARYEMASLLAHTKSMVSNMFGGTQMTAISAGLDNIKKARDMDYIRKTFSPTFKNRNDLKRAVAEEGVIEEYLINEAGGMNINVTDSLKNFFDDYARKLAGDEVFDDVSLRALAKKHHVSDALYSKVSWFMRAPEVELRTDAFMAHYIQFYNMFNGALEGYYDEHGKWRFNPILSRLAKDGVKCTQFLYTAPYRPAIARSAMGKVLTRFQLWTYNSINTRSKMYEQAKIYGFREGTMEMDKFQRMMAMDLITLGLANAFMFSLFDSALPAPWSWLKDMSEWIFGDKKEKQSAFFGTYPYYVAPLQIISPPIIRAFPTMITSMISGDWQKFTDYTMWTMFPFGRLARDLHKSYLNPKSFIDRMTGLPFSNMQGFGKEPQEI